MYIIRHKLRLHDTTGCSTVCMNSTCLIRATRHPACCSTGLTTCLAQTQYTVHRVFLFLHAAVSVSHAWLNT